MVKVPRSSSLGYFVVFPSVGLALLVTEALPLLALRTPFALFLGAVFLSTLYGGRNAGLLATLLSAPISDYFIIQPIHSFSLDAINVLDESVFITIALIITSVTSARMHSEKLLRESEEEYRTIAETASDAIITIDEASTILFVNQAAEKTFGYSSAEMLGQNLTMLMPDYLRHAHQVGVDRHLKTGQKHLNWSSIELPGLHKDGHEFPLELSFGNFIKDGRHNFIGIARDITERKRAQEERERFFAVGSDLQLIAGFDGRFKWVNPASVRTLGWSSEELTSHPWLHFVHPEDHEKTLAESEKLFRGEETAAFENRYLHKDGSYRWMSWNVRPYLQEQSLYCAVTDITERKQLEEQLRQSQRLESIGQLAGGIAHDFNNLLTVIIGYGEMCLSRAKENDPLRGHLEQIKIAAERASTLTGQLLAFSRKQILQPKIVDLDTTVTNLDKMLQRLIGEHIELVTILEPKLGSIKADPGQIEQVLMNLAVNARDAMATGGKLTIETRNSYLDDTYARSHVGATAGPHVMLAVSDTGHGMDAETQARIFEPFFTTKESGKGTGLGLSMVYGIVKQSGGSIWVYSEPKVGTTFKVYLPMVEEKGEDLDEARIVSQPERGTETILLVEDDDTVRMLLLDILEAKGYKVLAAANGREGLDQCDTYKGPIHLLITDVVMPGMSGRQLVERFSPKRRDAKVLYMSGYTDDAIVHHGVLDPGLSFLQKPFTPDAAANKVRAVLDAVDR